MGGSFTQLWLHLVWGTMNRHPVITPDIQNRLYAGIRSIGERCGATVAAIGGIEDHVHVLVRIPPTLSTSVLVKHLKGASAHLINHMTGEPFRIRWQAGYGAFTVSRGNVDAVASYIRRQREHHASGRLNPSLEMVESSGPSRRSRLPSM